jgi:hypothetical protein
MRINTNGWLYKLHDRVYHGRHPYYTRSTDTCGYIWRTLKLPYAMWLVFWCDVYTATIGRGKSPKPEEQFVMVAPLWGTLLLALGTQVPGAAGEILHLFGVMGIALPFALLAFMVCMAGMLALFFGLALCFYFAMSGVEWVYMRVIGNHLPSLDTLKQKYCAPLEYTDE